MIKIEIICIGKIKEKYLSEACKEYEKRLSKYVKLNITELSDEPLTNITSKKDEEKIIDTESSKIENVLKKIINTENKNNILTIALSPDGKMYDSIEFSKKIEEATVSRYFNNSFYNRRKFRTKKRFYK